MREENIKVKVTIPIPFGKPDKNGVMYTEEAVSNAINNLHKNLPIIHQWPSVTYRHQSIMALFATTVLDSF